MKTSYVWIISGVLVLLWILLLNTASEGAYWAYILLLAAVVLVMGYGLNRPTS